MLKILWTDALIYLLVMAIISFVFYARKREFLAAPWQQVIRSRIGMASLVILVSYVSIALLDSVHFRKALDNDNSTGEVHYSVDVLSILDVIMMPLKERVEKTYSAPFATHLYAKETIELPDGSKVRDYSRLEFGGAHLDDPPNDRVGDMMLVALKGLGIGLVCWGLLLLFSLILLSMKQGEIISKVFSKICARSYPVPWHVMFLTTGIVILLISLAACLSVKYHIFGTDKVGQDVFYQAIKSIRTALIIGTLTTLVMLPFAILMGIMAGYFRGWIDDVIQYVYITLNSIPGVLLIASAVLMMRVYIDNHPDLFETNLEKADMQLLSLCLILGITSWTGLCRLLRGETLKLNQVDYIQAATAFGVKHSKIIGRHLLPNVMHIVLIAVVLDFSGLVLAEAVLAYVGVGVDPSMNSWGNMINGARLEMAREPVVWWSLLTAFIFMFTLVLAANLFSDVVRDAFDPRLRK